MLFAWDSSEPWSCLSFVCFSQCYSHRGALIITGLLQGNRSEERHFTPLCLHESFSLFKALVVCVSRYNLSTRKCKIYNEFSKLYCKFSHNFHNPLALVLLSRVQSSVTCVCFSKIRQKKIREREPPEMVTTLFVFALYMELSSIVYLVQNPNTLLLRAETNS